MRGIAGRQTRGLPTMARLHFLTTPVQKLFNSTLSNSVERCADTQQVALVT